MKKIDIKKEKTLSITGGEICQAIYLSEKWLVFPRIFINKVL